MQVVLKAASDLGVDEVDEWRRFQRADHRLASPFLAPEFTIAFGRHYSNARVAVFREHGEIVAIFAFEQHRFGLAKALAFDLSDAQAVLCRPDTDIARLDLLGACGISVFEFDHFAPHQVAMLEVRDLVIEAAPVIAFGNGYDQWLAGRRRASSSRMKKVLQKQRKLGREAGELEFRLTCDDAGDLRQLIEWKSAQYIRAGRSDRFADPRFLGFVNELFEMRSDDFALVLSRLDAGDRTAALYLSLRAGDRLAGWFPTHNPELESLSPGMACLLSVVEHASENGCVRLDLGEGAASYKESFKDFDDEVCEGTLERRSLQAMARRLQQKPKRLAMKVALHNDTTRRIARNTLGWLGRSRYAVASGRMLGRRR